MNKILLSLLLLITLSLNNSPAFALDYDYSSTKAVAIELYSEKAISTKDDIVEGERLPLRIGNDVYYNNRLILKKGTPASAKIETLITAGMNGFPAEIIINDFSIPGIDSNKLISEYSKVGQNRCLWVYPLKWALTPLYPAGSLTNFIYGGHANLKTTDKITVYYYPEWKP